MATVKSNPAPANAEAPVSEEEVSPVFTDENLLKMLTSPKSVVITLLAEKRKAYESAKAIADKEKNEHDAIVTTLKTLRADLADLAKIEQRGRKAKEDSVGDTSQDEPTVQPA